MLSAIARLATYIGTCLAVPVLRRKMPATPRTIRLPGGPIIPIVALIICLLFLSAAEKKNFIAGAHRPRRRRARSTCPRGRAAARAQVAKEELRRSLAGQSDSRRRPSGLRAAQAPAPSPGASRHRDQARPGCSTARRTRPSRTPSSSSRARRSSPAGSGIAVPAGATVIDLGDATLLPGFIDCHTHLTGEAGRQLLADFFDGLRRPPTEQVVLRRGLRPKNVLEAGFTTVRDVGLREGPRRRPAQRDRRRGSTPGPRMLVARYALGATGGHCDNTGFPPGTFGPEPGARARHPPRAPTRAARRCASTSSTAPTSSRCAPRAASCRSATTCRPRSSPTRSSRRSSTRPTGSKRRTAAHSHGDLAARSAVKAGDRLDRARLVPDRRDARPHEVEGDVSRADLHGGAVDRRQAREVSLRQSPPRRRRPSRRTTT